MSIGNRIIIIGSPGSGKSTFSRELAEITRLPLVHLDKHFWNAGWIETPKEEFYAWQREVVETERWIIDGNYGGSMDMRLARADTVINFELSRIVCAFSCFKRVFGSLGKTRADMAEGCPEYLDLKFVKYIWDFPKGHGKRNRMRLADFSGTVISFTSRSQANGFLRDLKQSCKAKPRPLEIPKNGS